MDDFSRGSENLSEQGLDSLKENGRAVAQKVGKVAQRGIRNGARKATKGVRSAMIAVTRISFPFGASDSFNRL